MGFGSFEERVARLKRHLRRSENSNSYSQQWERMLGRFLGSFGAPRSGDPKEQKKEIDSD